MAEIHIGTSGWTYDHWLGRFYPAEAAQKGPRESRLAQYARTFRSVEINASFYRLPTEKGMASWLADTPPGFVFTAKVSRFISHMKRLREIDARDGGAEDRSGRLDVHASSSLARVDYSPERGAPAGRRVGARVAP